jgi:hypothetical protein
MKAACSIGGEHHRFHCQLLTIQVFEVQARPLKLLHKVFIPPLYEVKQKECGVLF